MNADAYRKVLTNVATPGPGGECVTASDCRTVHTTPHYLVWKTSDPASGSTVQPGDSITYTLHMSNDSSTTVTIAKVTDTLPAHVTITGTLPTGLVDNGDGTLTWTVASLAAGADTSIDYTVKVDAGAYGVAIADVITPGRGGDCDTSEGRSCTTTHHTAEVVLDQDVQPVARQ